jgi:hypothetical protein
MIEDAVGILAFGSLIDRPGWEIDEGIIGRKAGVLTPFSVEFARKSVKRGGAPTLVPVEVSGSRVLEPIREVPIHDERFAARRRSMMRIIARRMNAAAVVA